MNYSGGRGHQSNRGRSFLEIVWHIPNPKLFPNTCSSTKHWKDLSFKKEMATHSCILAWKMPWTEGPGGLKSMGSQSRTRLSDFTFTFKFQEEIEIISLFPWLSFNVRDTQILPSTWNTQKDWKKKRTEIICHKETSQGGGEDKG